MNNKNLKNALLFALGVAAPLGSGMQNLSSIDISKLYPMLCVIVILTAFFARQPNIGGYSRTIWIFLGFIALHTFIVYGFFYPNEFGFGYTGSIEVQGAMVRMSESRSIMVARLILFAFSGWAVARIVNNPMDISFLAFGYLSGLLFSIFTGGYQTEYAATFQGTNEIRIAAGLLNPNAFGLTALTCFLLLFTVRSTLQRGTVKIICYIGIIVSGASIFMSGSRGALLAAIIGAIVYHYRDKRKLSGFVTIIFFFYLAYVLVNNYRPDVAISSLERSSLERSKLDKGAGRLMIWHDYLTRSKEYLFFGVGYKRSMETLNTVNYYRMAATHNVFLGFLVEFGLAGLVLFLRTILSLYRTSRNAPAPYNLGLIALLSSWAIQSFFLDSMDLRETWLIFGLCSSTLCVKQNYNQSILIFANRNIKLKPNQVLK